MLNVFDFKYNLDVFGWGKRFLIEATNGQEFAVFEVLYLLRAHDLGKVWHILSHLQLNFAEKIV